MQRRKEKKVIEDFLKMIPFSFFLIVPGAELLLPFWLSIFPNSLPS
jgi:LETM1 and EF-hand domain-containing protein 1